MCCIMRKEGSSNFERSVKNAHNLEEVRKATSEYKEEVKESLKLPLQLLRDITSRLKLKGENFILVESADNEEIEDFWEVLLLIDDSDQTVQRVFSPADLSLRNFLTIVAN